MAQLKSDMGSCIRQGALTTDYVLLTGESSRSNVQLTKSIGTKL